MIFDLKDKMLAKKEALINKYRDRIQEKAIERTKVRIVLHGKSVSDYKEEDLAIIVKEEEGKIKNDLKTKGYLSILALLGLNSL